jgi:hypothetical protein
VTTTTHTRRWRRVKRTFRRRWVQACVLVLVWLAALGGTTLGLAPKTGAKADKGKLAFMHCDNPACKFELPYNKDMDGKQCPKCRGQDAKTEGFFVGTEKSIKTTKGMSEMSPWTRIYMILFVETVLMLGFLTYLMYRTIHDPATQFFMIACPHCNQRLRYRAVSHGGQGACSRCKRILRFPDEEDAVSEEEVFKADAEAAAAEAARLRSEAEADAEARERGS